MAEQWRVKSYLIMPDHTHLFCTPGVWPPTSVKRWASYWKGLVSRALKGHGPLAGICEQGLVKEWKWLRDVWDTQMRDARHYTDKKVYVAQNPVRKGLVERVDEWPFQGELGSIQW